MEGEESKEEEEGWEGRVGRGSYGKDRPGKNCSASCGPPPAPPGGFNRRKLRLLD